MSIYGIGQFDSFQSHYRIGDIAKVDVQQQNNLSVTPVLEASENSTPLIDKESEAVRRYTDPREISIGINKNDDFSYIGKDKDIQNLDIRKAISDMQKDSILQDYQYFVGSARNFRSEDGLVLQKQ